MQHGSDTALTISLKKEERGIEGGGGKELRTVNAV